MLATSIAEPILFRSPTHQLYLEYVGKLRPHVDHWVICLNIGGNPVIRCIDCGEDLTGRIHSEIVREALIRHEGHILKCTASGHEVSVICETCHEEIAASTPF